MFSVLKRNVGCGYKGKISMCERKRDFVLF